MKPQYSGRISPKVPRNYLVISKADKGVAIVIQDISSYIQEAT